MTDISRESVERAVNNVNNGLIRIEDLEVILALRAEVDRLEAKLAERVTVKPLVWVKEPWKVLATSTPFGSYCIYECSGRYAGKWNPCLNGAGIARNPHRVVDSEDAAKAAAQADYKRRILSALTTAPITPAEEFVAKVQQHDWQHDEPNDRADLPDEWLDYIEEMELFCNWVGMLAKKSEARAFTTAEAAKVLLEADISTAGKIGAVVVEDWLRAIAQEGDQ